MTKPICHRFHVPSYPEVEFHHVIPQAWQHNFRPVAVRRILWAPETVPLTPTCHRHVHTIIVELMRAHRDVRVYRTPRSSIGRIATAALFRFELAGGSLDALIAVGLYGEA